MVETCSATATLLTPDIINSVLFGFKRLAASQNFHIQSDFTEWAKRMTYTVMTLGLNCGFGRSVGIATDYGMDGPGIESR